jgi:hypothetical protein
LFRMSDVAHMQFPGGVCSGRQLRTMFVGG